MLTTLQNKQRHRKLTKILANRKPRKKLRPSQRPVHLQSKHETRVLSITLERYDTSKGYWPVSALYRLADLQVRSAIEYIEQLLKDCYTNIKMVNSNTELKGKLAINPLKLYESYTVDNKYYHGIPNNISFQKLMARLQASTPVKG